MVSVHLLSLSLDNHLLDPTSDSVARQQNGAKYFSHQTIIVLNWGKKRPIQRYSNLDIVPVNAWGKLDLLPRAFACASHWYKTLPFQLITCEDSLVTARVGKWLKAKFHIPLNIQIHPEYSRSRWEKIIIASHLKSADSTVSPIHFDFNSFYKPAHYRPTIKKFLSIGELTPEYGYSDLIDGFSRVTNAYPEATLTIIGDGPEKNILASMIINLGLNDRIFLLGEKSNKESIALLHQQDILIYTGSSIGYGEVIIQGFASGLPIITSPVKEGEDLLQPQTNCLVATGSEGYTSCLTTCLAHPEEAYRLAKNGQQWVMVNLESAVLPKYFARQLLDIIYRK